MIKLFIFMRNDLTSLNPGKAMAQAAHAANAMESKCKGNEYFESWKTQTGDGFGTTIVLSVTKIQIDDISFTLHKADTDLIFFSREANKSFHDLPKRHGIIIDPTYPVKDGVDTYLVRNLTCSWALMTEEESDVLFKYLKKNYDYTLDLHS